MSVELWIVMKLEREKTQVNDDFTVFLNFLLPRSFSIHLFCYSTQISNLLTHFTTMEFGLTEYFYHKKT